MGPYYQYTPCEGSEGILFTSNVSPANIVGTIITFPGLLVNGELITGQCYYVSQVNTLLPYNPDVIIDWETEVFITFPTCEDCVNATNPDIDCLCSDVTNTGLVTDSWRYIDCDGNLVSDLEVLPGETSEKLCVRQWLNQNGDIRFYGECINGECPKFYLLTNCSNEENTFCSNSVLLEQYVDTNIAVTLYGKEYEGKCYTITLTEECLSPVNVTVNQVFAEGCVTCQAQFIVNYELVNCVDDTILYTSTDLSTYVDQTVRLSVYGNNCYYVRVLTTGIPSDTPVEVTESFADCPECLSQYYLLTDCAGNAAPIVTITDLIDYKGSVVRLTSCPDICWSVTDTFYDPNYQNVVVLDDYIDCPECLLIVTKVTCVTFTNNNEVQVSVDYTNSEGIAGKIDVASRSTSAKVCAIEWNLQANVTATEYGECIDNVCPPTIQPRRSVTPGYNTPVCSTEYYENVECNFAEWMYKDVLQKRYGISNCCPEELTKWEIKHDMLMLDVLINPDYECTATDPCGCVTSSDCGYLSSAITHQCPPTICHNYVITIQAEETTVFYRNCLGIDVSFVHETNVDPVEYTVCGISGQNTSTIYAVGVTAQFSFIESGDICTS